MKPDIQTGIQNMKIHEKERIFFHSYAITILFLVTYSCDEKVKINKKFHNKLIETNFDIIGEIHGVSEETLSINTGSICYFDDLFKEIFKPRASGKYLGKFSKLVCSRNSYSIFG